MDLQAALGNVQLQLEKDPLPLLLLLPVGQARLTSNSNLMPLPVIVLHGHLPLLLPQVAIFIHVIYSGHLLRVRVAVLLDPLIHLHGNQALCLPLLNEVQELHHDHHPNTKRKLRVWESRVDHPSDRTRTIVSEGQQLFPAVPAVEGREVVACPGASPSRRGCSCHPDPDS